MDNKEDKYQKVCMNILDDYDIRLFCLRYSHLDYFVWFNDECQIVSFKRTEDYDITRIFTVSMEFMINQLLLKNKT